MLKRSLALLILSCLGIAQQAAFAGTYWFVSHSFGSDTNKGVLLRPFKTIQKAADTAVEGDTIMVLPGTYREWVHPKASGVAYRCAPPGTCVIKGSEVFTGWEATADINVYKKTIAHSYFQVPGGKGGTPEGNYNPYAANMVMDSVYQQFGTWVSRGQVYWDDDGIGDDALLETKTKEEMIATPRTWWIERGVTDTSDVTIWAHFPSDPAGHTVELNVRLACFDPSYWVGPGYFPQPTWVPPRPALDIDYGPRINSLTVEGFHMCHAAPDWGEIKAYQRGLISTNWGHSWKIRYNHFSDSKAACVTSGTIIDFGSTWNNGAGLDGPPYNQFGVGNHEISHNIIERCGAGGIHGNRGLSASRIEYNLVQDINYQRLMGGLGIAGIHPMTAIDTLIKNNIVRRVRRGGSLTQPNTPQQWNIGIWVEFAGQGVRSTGNIIYDIEGILHHFEATHGPMLADNNILWNSLNVDQTRQFFTGMQTSSYQSIFTNNLIVNSGWRNYISQPAQPYLWTPHTSRSTLVYPTGRAPAVPKDSWYVNNIMVERGSAGLANSNIAIAANPNANPAYPGVPANASWGATLNWNAYWNGATKATWEGSNSIVQPTFDPEFRIDESYFDGVRVSFCADSSAVDVSGPRISGDSAMARADGLIPYNTDLPSPSQTIETHTAGKITIDRDILGRLRNSTTVVAGPLAKLSTESGDCSSRNVVVLRVLFPNWPSFRN